MGEGSYEIKLTGQEKNDFINKMYAELKKRKMRISELAEAINYKPNTIYQFISRKEESSKFVAAEIAQYLWGDEQNTWKEKENGKKYTVNIKRNKWFIGKKIRIKSKYITRKI